MLEDVPIGTALAMAFLGVALVAWGRSAGSRFIVGTGLAMFAAIVVVLVRDGVRMVVVGGPVNASLAIGSILVGSLALAQVVSLPRGPARILGLGMRSRTLVFDNRLIALREQYFEALRLADSDPAGRAHALLDAEEQTRRIRALRPPDPTWALLRNDMADDFDRWIDLRRTDAPPERLSESIQAGAPVVTRWTQMREQAALDQRLMATPARRRRGESLFAMALSLTFLLLGATTFRAYEPFASSLADPKVLLALFELAVGVVASVGSVVLLLRR
jgi:hypothetical protein